LTTSVRPEVSSPTSTTAMTASAVRGVSSLVAMLGR
jgi:hypothetical protein